ncbi:MAG: HAMP domain-containing sensor histidine kinase [Patescibacteria group bacterium]
MEIPRPSHLVELGQRTINPLIFWGVITIFLSVVLGFMVREAGVADGIHVLFLVPVAAYLIIMGFFIGYVAKLNRERSRLLAAQIHEESAKVGEFKKLNQELEAYAKQLFDKDFELTLANKRLQNLEQAKSKFVAVTTHQLRTPLSAIKWTFHMLLQGSLGPTTADQHTFIEKGYESTQRMIAIINDLLNVDYMDVDRADYNFLPVDLPALIDSVMFEFTNQAESQAVALKSFKPPSTLPRVIADPIKLSMVLENLLDNAMKYTPKGGQVTVSVGDARMNSAESSLEVTVSDTGIGIPSHERDKIFHRFFRGSNAIKTQTDGTGLGLFISRDIIEKHGGAIWFESEAGRGTQFHFTIPINRNNLSKK